MKTFEGLWGLLAAEVRLDVKDATERRLLLMLRTGFATGMVLTAELSEEELGRALAVLRECQAVAAAELVASVLGGQAKACTTNEPEETLVWDGAQGRYVKEG